METPSILLMTEGTYPCHTGGVSVWCDKLIRSLHEFDFHLLAVTGSPSAQPVFGIPDNVISMRLLPLWGTEEPGAELPLFSETYRRKIRTSPRIIREQFLPAFEDTLRALLARGAESEALAYGMLRLYQYFREYDYARSMRSPEAWDIFVRVCAEDAVSRMKLTLDEATCCMRWLQRYLAVLSVECPHVKIAHASMSGFAAIPGVILKMLHGAHFLLSEHGLYLRETYLSLGESSYSPGRRSFLLALNEAVIRMNYHFTDEVTSLCEFNRRWAIRLGADPRKIRIAPNGVDEKIFHGPRPELHQTPVVLVMSRIMPLKGVDVLLRAALQIRHRVPNVRFRILGEAAHKEYYRSCMDFIAEHGLTDVVEVGHTDDPASAYRTADVFCLPSISEAMPYSVIEAMFSGCPVVATDVGGVRELLGGAGVVVKPNDPKSLADAISDLLAGLEGLERRRQLADAGRERAQRHYTLRQSTDRFRRIYKEFDVRPKGPNAIAEMPEFKSKRYSVATG